MAKRRCKGRGKPILYEASSLDELTAALQADPKRTLKDICAGFGRAPNYTTKLLQHVGDEAYEAAKERYMKARDSRAGSAYSRRGDLAPKVDEEVALKLDRFLVLFAGGMTTNQAVLKVREEFGSFSYSTVIARTNPRLSSFDEAFAERFVEAEAHHLAAAEGNFQREAAEGDWRAAEKLLSYRHPHYRKQVDIMDPRPRTTNVFFLQERASSALRGALLAAGEDFEVIDAEPVRELAEAR